MVLAEAGTGVGKTLGYLAPATVWAGKNKGSVWVSTYTRALQRQIDQEMDRLFEEPGSKNRSVVVRKGRENYLCLLNLQEAGQAGGLSDRDRIGLVITARWAERSRSGDMVGGRLPGLADRPVRHQGHHRPGPTSAANASIPAARTTASAGSRKNIRNARNARLGYRQPCSGAHSGWPGPGKRLCRSTSFSTKATTCSTPPIPSSAPRSRAWKPPSCAAGLLGPEVDRRGRGRGLRVRMEEVVTLDPRLPDLLKEVEQGAYTLPGPGWYQRLRDGTPDGAGRVLPQLCGASRSTPAPTSPATPFPSNAPRAHPSPACWPPRREFQDALGRLLKPVQDLRACLIDVLEQPTGQGRRRPG